MRICRKVCTMFEFMSDPTNQFIIIVALTILSVVGPIIVYLKQRVRKSIQFKIVSRTALFNVREEMKKELEIMYRGRKIEDAQLVLIEISNTGNIQIEEKDYIKPISFDFGEKAQVLTAEVIRMNPEELQASTTIDKGTISLMPVLTNAGDSFTLKIIVSGLGEVIKPSSRISGVKHLEEAEPPMNRSQWLLGLSFFLSFFGGFLSLYTIASNWMLGLLFFIIAMGGVALYSTVVIWMTIEKIRTYLRRKSSK